MPLGQIVHTLSHALADGARRSYRHATRNERRLRIGVDIRPFYEPLTGIGWYLYHLLHELAKRDDVELFLFGDARVTDLGPQLQADIPTNAQLCWFDLRGRGKISRADRALTAAAYVLWMKLIGCDVMFGPNYFLPRLLGAVARRRVITVHDLTYKRFPELLQKETLANLESHMQREIALADAIVCVSETTRQDLLEFYEVDPQRVVTIHSGVAITPLTPALSPQAGRGSSEKREPSSREAGRGSSEKREPSPREAGRGWSRGAGPGEGLPARYILFVSTIEPRKNLSTLLDAFDRLKKRGAYDGALVVVGKIGWETKSIARRLRGRDIHHLDYLGAEPLAAVYRNAEMFVFPSIYEGFGFPLLEAMAHGVPAIAARSSSLPEIGGDATLYFDPTNACELEQQIERLLQDSDLRRDLVARGLRRAAMFRWDVTAERTLEVLRRAV